MASRLNWRGDEVAAKIRSAERDAVNSVMTAAVLHAKGGHERGARGSVTITLPGVSGGGARFQSDTGELVRSIRITQKARREGDATVGRWGSQGLAYARRIELGFQGKDSAGRVVDAPPYPFLRPAAEARYPMLPKLLKRAIG